MGHRSTTMARFSSCWIGNTVSNPSYPPRATMTCCPILPNPDVVARMDLFKEAGDMLWSLSPLLQGHEPHGGRHQAP